ncbi:MAG: efflux RND transporter permease subunit [Thermoanaerobaculaceae bacterium]|nr:efflux RND transporter permease subunit [Thermoanaerobaculaceae bacterium]MDI9622490.1 efflux RND transporter permease subunit [Acidobacteriota bacterium]NLH11509.1 TolC family protein [Holophagae bacterium]HPW55908.1 efflux RND transporter permease subunit [Thermoanaerobaculaceae bacterium]
MFLSNLSIKRPVLATVMMLALVTLGLFSYRRLAIDMMPDVEIPVLSIITVFPGASPETVEREVSKRIEEAVNPIHGVKHVVSTSREGLSSVVVEFNLEVKINEASSEARAKINGIINELPAGIQDPVIQKLDFAAMPIVSLAVRSDTLSARDLTTLVDRKVKRRLENVPGVGKVKLVGDSTREVSVELDPARLQALGMGVDEVIFGLRTENVNTPLGRLNRGATETPMRVAGKPKDADEYPDMVFARRGPHPVTLGEVATVVDGIEEQRSLALVDGVSAVAVDIMKQSKANTVEVVDNVKKVVDALRAEMPAGTEIRIVRDSSTMIRESVADVKTTLVIGGLLTVFIVFLFLNSWRSTVITGLTLPISVISSFIAMYFLGMTVNTLTLMALSLAIGFLIDDAIVVRENIVRHLERGQDHFTAAREGTAEIGLAVLATSMSIIAVFVPVAFMQGIIGRFFYQFGLTVAFAVMVSLFVSFTLDPMLSSRWYDPDIERTGKRHLVNRILDRFNGWFDRTADRYKSLIGWALDHRKTVLGLAVAAFAGGLGIMGMLQSEFFPVYDRGEFVVRFKSAPTASIAETSSRMQEVLEVLGSFPEIAHTYATIGAGDADTVRDAMVYIKLTEKSERRRTQEQLVSVVRTQLEQIPGLILSVQDDPHAWEKPFQMNIRGEDIALLKQYAAAVKRELYSLPGITDVEATLELDLPEYRILVDRQRAAAAGLGTAAIANTVGALVGGQVVSTYEDETGEAVNVRVRLPLDLRQDITQVGNLRLSVPSGGAVSLVPLADLVRFERSTSPSEINRRDLARQVVVSANLDHLPLGTAGDKAMAAVAKIQLAPGYSIALAGDTEIMVESFTNLAEALLLAIIFVYLILAAQFESFIDPLSIMLSLPLSIVGMAGMLVLTGDTRNIMSQIGLILLMGLVTKNAILLVDFTKVLRGRGLERREAIITAGRTRLRPIMMTTGAMIFGMLPLALAIGQGAEMRAPMARAVVGGLITSTLLTLIIVPVVYTLLDDFAQWLHRRMAGARFEAHEATKSAAAVLLVASLVGAFAGPVSAQPPAPLKVMTLEQALGTALEKNKDVQKAVEFQNWLRAKYVEARAAAFPHLTLSGGMLRQYDDTQRDFLKDVPEEFKGIFSFKQDVTTWQLGVNQALFTWGQVGAAIRGAKVGLAMGEDGLRRYRQAVRRDVTAAYVDVLLAKEMEVIALRNVELKRRHLDEARRKHEAGIATDYDVLAAEVALSNAKPGAISAANAVRTARQNLGFLLGEEAVEIDATGAIPAPADEVPTYDAVLASALVHRPELVELGHRRDAQKELVKIYGAADRPRLDLQASYGGRDLDTGKATTGGKNWSAGVFLTFRVFDGLETRGQVAAARSELATYELEHEKLRQAIAVEARLAINAAAEAAQIVEALSGTVQEAEKLLFMAEKGYELGVKTHLDVEDAQLNLMSARGNLARARRDLAVARVHVDWVAGTLGENAA